MSAPILEPYRVIDIDTHVTEPADVASHDSAAMLYGLE